LGQDAARADRHVELLDRQLELVGGRCGVRHLLRRGVVLGGVCLLVDVGIVLLVHLESPVLPCSCHPDGLPSSRESPHRYASGVSPRWRSPCPTATRSPTVSRVPSSIPASITSAFSSSPSRIATETSASDSTSRSLRMDSSGGNGRVSGTIRA